MNRLDEIEARANAATEGPWEADWRFTGWDISGNDYDDDGLPALIASDADGEDADFIAHARTDMPALVAVARYALSQHAPDGHGNCGPCDDATGEDGWPCSTVREIHRLLGEDA